MSSPTGFTLRLNISIFCDLAVFYVEELVVEVAVRQDLVYMVAVGVGDEYLAEAVAGHQSDDLLHAVGIELVEDVVEQEQGQGGALGAEG